MMKRFGYETWSERPYWMVGIMIEKAFWGYALIISCGTFTIQFGFYNKGVK